MLLLHKFTDISGKVLKPKKSASNLRKNEAFLFFWLCLMAVVYPDPKFLLFKNQSINTPHLNFEYDISNVFIKLNITKKLLDSTLWKSTSIQIQWFIRKCQWITYQIQISKCVDKIKGHKKLAEIISHHHILNMIMKMMPIFSHFHYWHNWGD